VEYVTTKTENPTKFNSQRRRSKYAYLLPEVVDNGAESEPHELVDEQIGVVVLIAPLRVKTHVGQRMREALGGTPGLRKHDVLEETRH
jgi:hypothetical protein